MINFKCKSCNKDFNDSPSRKRNFCSRKCYDKWQSSYGLFMKQNPRKEMRVDLKESFLNRTLKTDYCWVWLGGITKKGYGTLRIKNNGAYKSVSAHRTSWKLFNGEIPRGLMVCHICDNPCCVNPGHLFLGTAKDNTMDMISKGRHNFTNLKGYKHAH